MKALLERFKEEKVTVDGLSFTVFRKLSKETIDLSDELIRKMTENEELAESLLLSLVSTYSDTDLVKLSIIVDGVHHEFLFLKDKNTKRYPLFPKITRLLRLYLVKNPTNIASEEVGEQIDYSPIREIVLDIEKKPSNVYVHDFSNEERYLFESKLEYSRDEFKGKLLILETEDGISIIDEEILNKYSLEIESTKTETSRKTKTKKTTKRKSRSRKRRKKSKRKTKSKS